MQLSELVEAINSGEDSRRVTANFDFVPEDEREQLILKFAPQYNAAILVTPDRFANFDSSFAVVLGEDHNGHDAGGVYRHHELVGTVADIEFVD